MGGDGERACVCGRPWEAHRNGTGASSACRSWGLHLGTINQLVWGHLWGSGSPQALGAPGHRLAHWSPTPSQPTAQLLQWVPSDPVTMATSLQLEQRSRQILL